MSRTIDLTGQKFGRWTVIEQAPKRPGITNAYWKCRCECGNTGEVPGTRLIKGKSLSCGCLRNELFAKKHTTHNQSKSRLYIIWRFMKSRCRNPNDCNYYLYGARGIDYCDEWEDFETFRKWAISAGYDEKAPRGVCTLDRADVNGNYNPQNCRWVDAKTQAINRRDNNLVTANGDTKTIAEWAEEKGINYYTLWDRIMRRKWDVDRALNTPSPCRRKEEAICRNTEALQAN